MDGQEVTQLYTNIQQAGSRKKAAGGRSLLRPMRIRETSGQSNLTPLQEALFKLKAEIEEFCLSLEEPALYQNGLKLGSLEELTFSVECFSSQLLLSFQISSKRVKRRILNVHRGRLVFGDPCGAF